MTWFSRFRRTPALLCLLLLGGGLTSQAATSYLLVQGNFGPGNTLQTFDWQVNYTAGTLTTGIDLLEAVFGKNFVDQHTSIFGAEQYTLTSAQGTVGLLYFPASDSFPASYLIDSFTLGTNNTTIKANTSSLDPGWVYYVAGGSGAETYANNGTWTYSDDGATTRLLANGSYDGYAFGESFTSPFATISGTNPTTSGFTGAIVINAPEPGRVALLAAGLGLALLRRRRTGVGHVSCAC